MYYTLNFNKTRKGKVVETKWLGTFKTFQLAMSAKNRFIKRHRYPPTDNKFMIFWGGLSVNDPTYYYVRATC